MDNFDVVIIGAGPAGLTAGYELSKSNKKVLVLEKKNQVGGLAETKVYGDYRYDIGPHRFFTKNVISSANIFHLKPKNFKFKKLLT